MREDDVAVGAGSQGVGRRLVTSVEDHAWAPCQLDNDARNYEYFFIRLYSVRPLWNLISLSLTTKLNCPVGLLTGSC